MRNLHLGKKNMLSLVFAICLLGLNMFTSPLAWAVAIVVPPGFELTEGDNGQNTAVRDLARTLQIVYAVSQLSGLPAGSSINGMAFRLNGGTDSGPASDRTWINYDIQFSSSLNPPGSLSSTFAANIGPDVVTVRSGTLTIPGGSFPGGSTPNAFGFLIPFTIPYAYGGGDLLITIRHTGNGVDWAFLDSDIPASVTLYQSIAADSYDATT
ncbi:MAG: hypothetical protein ACOY3D_08450, partial [Candidatus Omnitrophota bacterium]